MLGSLARETVSSCNEPEIKSSPNYNVVIWASRHLKSPTTCLIVIQLVQVNSKNSKTFNASNVLGFRWFLSQRTSNMDILINSWHGNDKRVFKKHCLYFHLLVDVSHYLNQCWLITSIIWDNGTGNAHDSNHYYAFGNYISKLNSKTHNPRHNEFNCMGWRPWIGNNNHDKITMRWKRYNKSVLWKSQYRKAGIIFHAVRMFSSPA